MQPYWEGAGIRIYLADCRELLLEPLSIDAVITDPPYGLKFMGKGWDAGVPGAQFWRGFLAACKPGAHLLSFGGTRTFHRLACAIEDADWQLRDTLMFLYGTGFPKSLDISKQLDSQEKQRWLNLVKAIDNVSETVILEAWKEHSRTAKPADLRFRKSTTATGTNTRKSDSVLVYAAAQVSLKKSDVSVIAAELSLIGVPLMFGTEEPTALISAGVVESRDHVVSAQRRLSTLPIAQCGVREWLNENTVQTTRAVEALKTWLGSKPSLKQVDINALCAALTADLKLTILNHSKTFQSLDTKSQTDFVSAITITTTESTAASLISSTVATLKRKAIDRAAGADRVVTSTKKHSAVAGSARFGQAECAEYVYSEPATDEAKEWSGYGTALKPAWEPLVLARKPLEGTVSQNVLKWGCGALNIDGCRVAAEFPRPALDARARTTPSKFGAMGGSKAIGTTMQGRWPANVITDGSDEVVGMFPTTGPSKAGPFHHADFNGVAKGRELAHTTFGHNDDGGSAARFFYSAKASKRDRGEGNIHPTVKPTALMEYLITLITRPGHLILDPFMGSGSTLVAASRLGRSAIGADTSEQYCEIAANRISKLLNTEEND